MTATTVSYHAEGYAAARPAINVKLYVPGADYWPFRGLVDADNEEPIGRTTAADLVDAAYNIIQSDFWQAAEEIATQRGLGEIAQEGRNGGWLVFTDGRDPEDAETFCGEHPEGPTLDDREAVAEWLDAYRAMAEWADAFIADAPHKVRTLAQSLAMDEAGESAALRMFAFERTVPA